VGIAKDGSRKPSFQRGMELHAKYTLFAEGARGSLSQTLMSHFNLRDGVDRRSSASASRSSGRSLRTGTAPAS